jgi:hypothetical protein
VPEEDVILTYSRPNLQYRIPAFPARHKTGPWLFRSTYQSFEKALSQKTSSSASLGFLFLFLSERAIVVRARPQSEYAQNDVIDYEGACICMHPMVHLIEEPNPKNTATVRAFRHRSSVSGNGLRMAICTFSKNIQLGGTGTVNSGSRSAVP